MTHTSRGRDEFGRSLEHRELWREVRSLVDAGELTAQWLEGKIEYQPTYLGVSIDPETEPLVDQLAQLNRCGLWTENSQPGVPLVEGNAQRQYVSGYCLEDTAAVLNQVTFYTELVVVLFAPGTSGEASIPVTLDGGEAYSTLGSWVAVSDPKVSAMMAVETNDEFAEMLSSCWHFQVFDPVWGRNNELLPELLSVLA